MTRKRSKMTRYNPARVKALRAEIAKCPNKDVCEDDRKVVSMTDGDMLDFAVHYGVAPTSLENSLKPVQRSRALSGYGSDFVARTIAGRLSGLVRYDRDRLTKDGGAILRSWPAWSDDDPDRHNSTQFRRFVDTGIGRQGSGMAAIRELQALQENRAGHGIEDQVITQLPEVVH